MPLYLRLLFGTLFFIFSFVFLYFVQGELLAEAQYVYSNGLTTYSIPLGALILTIVLLIICRVMNVLFYYPAYFYVFSYLPSFLLLAVITSVNTDALCNFTLGDWAWAIPLVLLMYLVVVLSIFPKIEQYKRKPENNEPLKSIWVNCLFFLVFLLITGAISNANNVLHYELKVERLIQNEKYSEALEVGKKSLETSRKLTEMRMYALAKSGRLCDDMFDYPQNYGTWGLLDVSDTAKLYYRFSSKNICASMGAYCGKSVKSTREYLQLMKNKYSLVDETSLDTLNASVTLNGFCKNCFVRNKKMVDSYYVAYLLLDKKVDDLFRYIDVDDNERCDSMPQAVKEALLIYKSSSMTNSFPSDTTLYLSLVDSITAKRFLDYNLISDTIRDSTERQNRLRRKFGDTFWWYYDYGHVAY